MDDRSFLGGWRPLRGVDGLLGTFELYAGEPGASSREARLSLHRFDETGACVETLYEWTAVSGPNFGSRVYDVAARGGMTAILRGELSLAQGGSPHMGSTLYARGKEIATFAPGKLNEAQPEHIGILRDGRIVLSASYFNPEFGPGVGTNAWVVGSDGSMQASAEWGGAGRPRVRAFEVSAQDEILVLTEVDSGTGSGNTSRIDRYDASLRRIDSWSPPGDVYLNAISSNAAGQLIVVGRRQKQAFAQLLEVSGWKSLGERKVPDGEAFSAELQDDGELLVVGLSSLRGQWLQRYLADGTPAWPEAMGLTPPLEQDSVAAWAVASQSNGHILATASQVLGYCD